MKKARFWLSCVTLTLIAIISVGELGLRLREHKSPYSLDPELGWVATGNYEFHGLKVDVGGDKYLVDVSTNKDGFRLFGDPTVKNKIKVLVIGDSMTHALEVSNDKTYYSVLNHSMPIFEVFAYGAGGYGTLQEYMILDRFIELIEPEVVIIQASWTDFVNNHYALERKSTLTDMRMRRPYLTLDGNTMYALPSRSSKLRDLANKSRFLNFVWLFIERRLPTWLTDSSEYRIIAGQQSYPAFKDAIEITDRIFKKIKSRVPANTHVFSFTPEIIAYNELKRISEQNGISFIDG
ncbi:MAG: hypothetical protein V3S55_07170, partial [Nitrospiraceae bacterium]